MTTSEFCNAWRRSQVVRENFDDCALLTDIFDTVSDRHGVTDPLWQHMRDITPVRNIFVVKHNRLETAYFNFTADDLQADVWICLSWICGSTAKFSTWNVVHRAHTSVQLFGSWPLSDLCVYKHLLHGRMTTETAQTLSITSQLARLAVGTCGAIWRTAPKKSRFSAAKKIVFFVPPKKKHPSCVMSRQFGSSMQTSTHKHI